MGYRTIVEEMNHEIIVNKSRFIGYVKPIASEEEAVEFIEQIKKKHWDATHNVPVYVLGENYTTQRYSDDGEPSGTAGVPVLEMLKKEHITDVVVVITRYFGGIKLGTGGLVRAYTQAAKETLNAVGVVDVDRYSLMSITCDYSAHGKIQNHLMNAYYMIENTVFQDVVRLTVYHKPEDEECFKKELMELTSGQADLSHVRDDMLAVEGKTYQVISEVESEVLDENVNK